MTDQAQIVDLVLRLSESNEPAQIVERFARSLVSIAEAGSVVVARLQPTSAEVELATVAGPGNHLRGRTFPIDGSTIGAATQNDEITTWATAGRAELDSIALRRLGARHVVGAPVHTSTRQYGSVIATYGSPPAASVLDMIGRLAQLLGTQLDRVDAERRLQREIETGENRTANLRTLHGLEIRLSSATSERDVLAVLASSIFDLVPATRVSYASRGPRPAESTVYAIVQNAEVSHGTVIALDEDQFDRTWASRAQIYNADHTKSGDEVHANLLRSGIYSSINLGVFVDGSPVGTLNVGCSEVDGLSPESRVLLATLASFMGSTLERIRAHERLVYHAHHDILTGLARRERFEADLEDEIVRLKESHGRSAICFLDLDRFKLVNDTQGHLVGDRLLKTVAQQLQMHVGPDDTVGRLGGDEFAVLLRDRPPDMYAEVCVQLVAAIASVSFVANDAIVVSGASAGWTLIDADTTSAHDALGAADAACYVAKSRGGSQAIEASLSDDAQVARRSAGRIVTQLRGALDEGRFALFAQPIRRLTATGPDGFEVLVRMRHPNGELASTAEFIPTAERYGLIADVDRWVCDTTLATLERAQQHGSFSQATTVFINVSANSIALESFVDDTCALLRRSTVNCAQLCFEITESGTMQDMHSAMRFIARVRELGASIALDDFGVGLSSLGSLQQLPIDYLKLDGSLVREIEKNPIDVAMVRAVRTLTDAMGILTIAEHIESATALDHIQSLGIDAGQGFYLGHPAPLEQVVRGSMASAMR